MSAHNHNTLTIGAEGNAASANLDPSLTGLPIVTVGQHDPLVPDRLNFPHMLYHGTKADSFTLNQGYNHRTAPKSRGARTGRGLYLASRATAETFGSTVAELIPQDAQLLDLESPEASRPLTAGFRDAYAKDYADNAATRVYGALPAADRWVVDAIWRRFNGQKGLITKTDIDFVATRAKDLDKTGTYIEAKTMATEIASQINTLRLITAKPDVSIRELFATADSISGTTTVPKDVTLTLEPLLDFLTAKGLDGAVTAQRFKKERAVVFWKLDRLGDRQTWEARASQRGRAAGNTALAGANVQPNPSVAISEIQGPAVVEKSLSDKIYADVSAGRPLAPASRMNAIARRAAGDGFDPLRVVYNLARSSPEMTALFAAATGVVEGYRLHEHTQAVLGRFEKEIAPHITNPKELQMLRMALLLQDSGKTLAVARNGNKNKQTVYNQRVSQNLLSGIDDTVLSSDEKTTVNILVGNDIIGNHLQGKTTIVQARGEYRALVAATPPSERSRLKKMMQIMYLCDASAYTDSAQYVASDGTTKSAKPTLNSLFTRDGRNRLQVVEPYRTSMANIF